MAAHPTPKEDTAISAVVALCTPSICSVVYQYEHGKKIEIDEVLRPFEPLSRQRILVLADVDHYHRTKPHDYCD